MSSKLINRAFKKKAFDLGELGLANAGLCFEHRKNRERERREEREREKLGLEEMEMVV